MDLAADQSGGADDGVFMVAGALYCLLARGTVPDGVEESALGDPRRVGLEMTAS